MFILSNKATFSYLYIFFFFVVNWEQNYSFWSYAIWAYASDLQAYLYLFSNLQINCHFFANLHKEYFFKTPVVQNSEKGLKIQSMFFCQFLEVENKIFNIILNRLYITTIISTLVLMVLTVLWDPLHFVNLLRFHTFRLTFEIVVPPCSSCSSQYVQ